MSSFMATPSSSACAARRTEGEAAAPGLRLPPGWGLQLSVPGMQSTPGLSSCMHSKRHACPAQLNAGCCSYPASRTCGAGTWARCVQQRWAFQARCTQHPTTRTTGPDFCFMLCWALARVPPSAGCGPPTLVARCPAGDRSTNLMWRLSNGELPAKAPKLVFVEIGMNDIGAVGITNPNAGDADYLAEADPTAARCGGVCVSHRARSMRSVYSSVHFTGVHRIVAHVSSKW